MAGSKKETHLILKHDLNYCVKSHFKRLTLWYKLLSEATACFHTTFSDTSFRIFYPVTFIDGSVYQQCIP